MAKSKQQSKQSGKSPRPDGAKMSFDLDQYLHKYIWLLLPILIIVYYLYSTNSTGFYQDDEIGHYRNIRAFWSDPFSIMGNQPKPGWKILLVLPGLLGFPGVLIAHCAITALTVVATYYLGRALRIKNSFVIAILLAVQPLFLQLSFRSYSEITAACVAVLMVLWFAQENGFSIPETARVMNLAEPQVRRAFEDFERKHRTTEALRLAPLRLHAPPVG